MSSTVTQLPTHPYSPTSILNIFSSALKTIADTRLVEVRGLFESERISRSYSGYFYESLKSEFDSRTLKIKIPVALREEFHDNMVYNLLGTIEKKVSNTSSIIEIIFVVDRILNLEKNQISEDDVLKYQILEKKANLGYTDFESKVKQSIFNRKKLKIANLYGTTGIVDRDFETGLGEAISNFEISNHRCNLSQPADIVSALKRISQLDIDIIALQRGGGDDGLKILNDPRIAEQVLISNKVFVTAIGHHVHNTLLDQIADKKFSLPLHFGAALREMVDRAKEEVQNSKGAQIDKVKEDLTKVFGDEIKSLKEQLKSRSQDLENVSIKHKEMVDKLQQDKNKTIEEISKSKDDQIRVLQAQLEKINSQINQVQGNYEKLIEQGVSNAVKQGENKLQSYKNQTNTNIIVAAIIAFLIGLFF